MVDTYFNFSEQVIKRPEDMGDKLAKLVDRILIASIGTPAHDDVSHTLSFSLLKADYDTMTIAELTDVDTLDRYLSATIDLNELASTEFKLAQPNKLFKKRVPLGHAYRSQDIIMTLSPIRQAVQDRIEQAIQDAIYKDKRIPNIPLSRLQPEIDKFRERFYGEVSADSTRHRTRWHQGHMTSVSMLLPFERLMIANDKTRQLLFTSDEDVMIFVKTRYFDEVLHGQEPLDTKVIATVHDLPMTAYEMKTLAETNTVLQDDEPLPDIFIQAYFTNDLAPEVVERFDDVDATGVVFIFDDGITPDYLNILSAMKQHNASIRPYNIVILENKINSVQHALDVVIEADHNVEDVAPQKSYEIASIIDDLVKRGLPVADHWGVLIDSNSLHRDWEPTDIYIDMVEKYGMTVTHDSEFKLALELSLLMKRYLLNQAE